MDKRSSLCGVIPALVTPLTMEGKFNQDNFENHINTLAGEGCDGIVVLGTTGEGPSFGLDERKAIIKVAVEASGEMLTIASTGCASLADTLALTSHAFASGADAVLVLPPFYYKNLPHDGLVSYYRHLIEEAVPENGQLLLYHIPQVTQVPITFELLESLLEIAQDKVAGVKDSSGDVQHLQKLCGRFPQLQIFAGNDRHLLSGLKFGTAGCITAGVNVLAPLNVAVYEAYKTQQGDFEALQEKLTAGRVVLEKYMPFPATMKFLLSRRYKTPGWEVRPPLLPLPPCEKTALLKELHQVDITEWLPWLEDQHLLMK